MGADKQAQIMVYEGEFDACSLLISSAHSYDADLIGEMKNLQYDNHLVVKFYSNRPNTLTGNMNVICQRDTMMIQFFYVRKSSR